MNFLLEVTDYSKPVENFVDRLTFGSTMLGIGIGIVFSVLIIIWASLVLFKIYFSKAEQKPKIEEPIAEPAVTTVTDDTEIVAVIAAAIAAAESEYSGIKFRVVSFKRK